METNMRAYVLNKVLKARQAPKPRFLEGY
jgi:hypothetical protein